MSDSASYTRLTASEEIFLLYAKEFQDGTASVLVDVVVTEAAIDANLSYASRGHETFIRKQAQKAASLWSNLPIFQKEDIYHRETVKDLPKTRARLCYHIIHGMLRSSKPQELAHVLLQPVKLSTNERKALQECLKGELTTLMEWDVKKIVEVIKRRPNTWELTIMRGLVQAITHCSEAGLEGILARSTS